MQGWFRLVFAVLAVLAVAAVVVVVSLLAAGRQASGDLENDILPAQAQAYRLQGALVDQETGVRGFGITGRRISSSRTRPGWRPRRPRPRDCAS